MTYELDKRKDTDPEGVTAVKEPWDDMYQGVQHSVTLCRGCLEPFPEDVCKGCMPRICAPCKAESIDAFCPDCMAERSGD